MLIKTFRALLVSFIFIMYACNTNGAKLEKATFAGGCFWCVEPSYERLEGVKEVIPGYTGGHKENPSYEEVSTGTTGHMEAVQITFDPSKITYAELIDVLWKQIDPTDFFGQFVDRGSQYRTAIFYHSEEQRQVAEKSKKELQNSDLFSKPIITQILPAGKFYEAEKYHHNYYKNYSAQYKFYRANSCRNQYLSETWGKDKKTEKFGAQIKKYQKPSKEELKKN